MRRRSPATFGFSSTVANWVTSLSGIDTGFSKYRSYRFTRWCLHLFDTERHLRTLSSEYGCMKSKNKNFYKSLRPVSIFMGANWSQIRLCQIEIGTDLILLSVKCHSVLLYVEEGFNFSETVQELLSHLQLAQTVLPNVELSVKLKTFLLCEENQLSRTLRLTLRSESCKSKNEDNSETSRPGNTEETAIRCEFLQLHCLLLKTFLATCGTDKQRKLREDLLNSWPESTTEEKQSVDDLNEAQTSS